ncbi:hypothetical protein E2562_004837 [Oryza meyeriana var. granulata]|uniref:Uncharacterized protein n=1 Tax=Oryza meyeriana var. granulata TaxID=110450 RepID=A0A6G1DEQ9_9ORYZ|nr:hypothetical protein E2562_004837 [Oryza meyeriana var. granulata]
MGQEEQVHSDSQSIVAGPSKSKFIVIVNQSCERTTNHSTIDSSRGPRCSEEAEAGTIGFGRFGYGVDQTSISLSRWNWSTSPPDANEHGYPTISLLL